MKTYKKGISLIVLVVTIIVLSILAAAVIISLSNTNIITQAQRSVNASNLSLAKEAVAVGVAAYMADHDGFFDRDDFVANIDEYISEATGNATEVNINGVNLRVHDDGSTTEVITSTSGWTEVAIPTGWDATKVRAMKETATNAVVPVPYGYVIKQIGSEVPSINTGVVITDGVNEFVWIPVTTTLGNTYTFTRNVYNAAGNSYADITFYEPKILTAVYKAEVGTYDHMDTISYWFDGKLNEYYTFDSDGNPTNYTTEYQAMVASVNKYDGFYVGRYEMTKNSKNKIGSEYNQDLFLSGTPLSFKYGTDNDARWHGMYVAAKNSDVLGNGNNVQTQMIWGVQWDTMIAYIRAYDSSSNVDTEHISYHPGTSLTTSGKANSGDVNMNIYDLEANGHEFTQLSTTGVTKDNERVLAGGSHVVRVPASALRGVAANAAHHSAEATRLTMYIK